MERSTHKPTQIAAVAVAGLGLMLASISTLYIAGLFGLSSALASQIVNAITVGGWVLAVLMAALSGGFFAAVFATARWAIARWGKNMAIA